jgi:glycosyltransferase involved in cell wall biosynthesis
VSAAVPGDRPDVTLVLTAWQAREDWLLASVRSALAQTGCRTELLVVDDGSEPPVEPLLADVAGRLRVLRVPHGGVAAARNAGVEHARGDYMRFIDADDAFPADSTARLLARVAGRQDVIAYGVTVVCDSDLRPMWTMPTHQQGDAVVDSLLARFNVRPGGMLWPRRLFERAGTFDTTLPMSEDWEFLQRALEHARVAREPGVVHYYRRHGSAMTSDYETGMRVAREIVDRYFVRHPEQRGSRLERRADAMLDAVAARVYATRGRPREALVHAARALRRDPFAFGNELQQALAAARGRLRGWRA